MLVCAGEALVDLVPDPRPGGGPMNTAVAAARLGVPTAFLGRVSTDAHGDTIWQHLTASGVDLRLTERGHEPTCRAEVVGDPPVFHFHGDGTADVMLSADATSPERLGLVGPGPHLLHGGTLSLFRQPAAELYAELAMGWDGLVSLDPNARPQIVGDEGRPAWRALFDRWMANVALLRMSDADAAWIHADEAGTDAEAVDVAVRSGLDAGAAAVVITESTGATVHTAAGSVSAPSQRVDVVDTVGAGDSFCGGVLAWLHDADIATKDALVELDLDGWRHVLDTAGRVAAVTVQRVGADPPRRAEVVGAHWPS